MTEEQNGKPIDVKTAVKAAIAYVRSLYDSKEIFDVSLEEVEYDTDGYWYITVGFTRSVTVNRRLAVSSLRALAQEMTNPTVEREYKIVTVRATDGQPLSMKIRKL
jgi:hypothetical protein